MPYANGLSPCAIIFHTYQRHITDQYYVHRNIVKNYGPFLRNASLHPDSYRDNRAMATRPTERHSGVVIPF